MPENINSKVRVEACRVLEKVIFEHESLNTCLAEALRATPAKDEALLQELVFGVCRWHLWLRQVWLRHLHRPVSKRTRIAEIILSLGAYQILLMRTPAHAAIHETVECCSALNVLPVKGMINAVLRKISQNPETPDTEACKQSHPKWMQDKLTHNWPEHTPALFERNNARPPMTLRCNALKTSREDYLKLLTERGIGAHASAHADQGIVLDKPCQVDALPNFDLGWVSVQDEAAQLCAQILQPQPGMRILDACAAPGGKTCALLELAPEINLTALDVDKQRSTRILDNLKRLQLKCDIRTAAAEDLDAWWDRKPYDQILLDAPCSATGVIRRHPDIKHLRRESDITALAALQLKMLSELWKTLSSGGTLLYATCSVFPQENSRIIERFLKMEESAELKSIEATWGLDTGFGRQLFPEDQSHDGFFYACLTKTKAQQTL